MTDAEIEDFARGICEELGLDPDEMVAHGYGGNMTPAEVRVSNDQGFSPAVALVSPRWQTYRARAAFAIATHRILARLEAE